ncbi:hypothetical protein M8J75_006458 [Diaphorina citri]|nr:hypothetical protein M8J75_006458 [Diaphorina citri]KAI5734569.1 hypothetical protein M8J77_008197 [Diaphorina citri]
METRSLQLYTNESPLEYFQLGRRASGRIHNILVLIVLSCQLEILENLNLEIELQVLIFDLTRHKSWQKPQHVLAINIENHSAHQRSF